METRTATPRRSAKRSATAEAEAAFDRILARIRANAPTDVTDEEIYRMVAEERRQIREDNRAARGR